MNLKFYMRKALQVSVLLCSFGVSKADSFTEFFRAIELDRPEAIRSLLAKGFPVNAINAYGQTGFTLALRGPSPKVADVLFEHPQFDLHQTTAAGETPLLIAAIQGDETWVQRLLDRGARMESPSGWTALHYAASGTNPAVVRLLLARNAPLNAQAANGNTPLHMAARFGDQRHVDLLLLAGADARITNQAGQTPADSARSVSRDRLSERLAEAAALRR